MPLIDNPINMLLFCPTCHRMHIDKPDPATQWDDPPHKSHVCQFCETIWRPADVPTRGVEEINEPGMSDTWTPNANP